MVIVLCCMHCTSTRPEQVLWTSLVAALRHLTDLTSPNLMQRLTNGFCHRCSCEMHLIGLMHDATHAYEDQRQEP